MLDYILLNKELKMEFIEVQLMSSIFNVIAGLVIGYVFCLLTLVITD